MPVRQTTFTNSPAKKRVYFIAYEAGGWFYSSTGHMVFSSTLVGVGVFSTALSKLESDYPGKTITITAFNEIP